MSEWTVTKVVAKDLEKMLNKINKDQEVISVFQPSVSFVVLSKERDKPMVDEPEIKEEPSISFIEKVKSRLLGLPW